MPVADLSTEMKKFMLPTGGSGDGDPSPSGWPDDGYVAPTPTQGMTLAGSPNNVTLVGAGFTPGALAGGTASISQTVTPPDTNPPPDLLAAGVKILSNTATQVVLENPINDGAGELTATIAASADDQVLFNLGTTDISLVTSVTRISPATDGAADVAVAGHNLATGMVGIGEMTPGVLAGEQIEFKYRRAGGPVPSGKAYLITPPRPPPGAAFTVGSAWSDAYGVYFGAGSPAPTPGSYAGAIAAMKATMDGLSAVPLMGAVSFTAGLLAFWGVVAAQAATIWPSLTAVSAVPPPPIFGVGPSILLGMTPLTVVPIPAPNQPGPGWSDARAQSDIDTMAALIALANDGGLIISQPGPAPVPVPFILG